MSKNKNIELRVGIVVLLAIGLLIAGMIVGNDFSLSGQSYNIKIKFDNAGGLKISEPVFISGVKKGKITQINSEEDGIIVIASLDSEIKFHSDARARILLKEITGGKKIEIDPGVSDELLSKSEMIQGEYTPDLGELVAIVGSVAGDAVSLIRSLDTLSTAANKLIADTSFTSDIKSGMNEVRDLIRNANAIFVGTNGISNTLKNTNSLISKLDNLVGENSEEITALIKDLRSSLSNLNLTLSNADVTMSKLNPTFDKIDELLVKLNTDGGLIDKIATDKEFAKNFEQAFVELLEFIKQARKYGVNVNASLGSNP